MLKKYRTTLIITTVITLLPVLAGLILWNRLPDEIPMHFNAAGEVDGMASKAVGVFLMPLIMVAVQWLCAVGSFKMDPKADNLNDKVMGLVLWIVPVLSVLLHVLVYGTALGEDMKVQVIIPLVAGLALTMIGNWLPKCKQTYTLGIKLPWTLADEDNWNRTHRFAGPLWVVGGLIIMVSALCGGAFLWVMLAVLLAMVFVPAVYSYMLFRAKQKAEDK
ncbi:MAG: SdpI family protein [Clostridia bacterium]|nr:SdpI family protein [Clostridia bacterium]